MDYSLLCDIFRLHYQREFEDIDKRFAFSGDVIKYKNIILRMLNNKEKKALKDYLWAINCYNSEVEYQHVQDAINFGVKIGMQLQKAFDKNPDYND